MKVPTKLSYEWHNKRTTKVLRSSWSTTSIYLEECKPCSSTLLIEFISHESLQFLLVNFLLLLRSTHLVAPLPCQSTRESDCAPFRGMLVKSCVCASFYIWLQRFYFRLFETFCLGFEIFCVCVLKCKASAMLQSNHKGCLSFKRSNHTGMIMGKTRKPKVLQSPPLRSYRCVRWNSLSKTIQIIRPCSISNGV